METIYVKPNGRIGGFTQGRVYKVLAISVDNNGQPVFSVADDEMNIKNIPAERFKYSPSKYYSDGPEDQHKEEVDVDYEVVDDGEDVEIDLHDEDVPEEENTSNGQEEEKKPQNKPKTQAKRGRPKKNTK